MKRILVTGGAGYIGAHTTVELLEAGHEAIVIDNFSKSDDTLLKGIKNTTGKDVTFRKGDCTDPTFLENLFKTQGPFDAVMHFAAYKSVGESVDNPLMYYRNNVQSLVVLLETMKKFNCSSMVFSSSCTVYGQPDTIPVDENAPFKKAESPYGATKQMCERILEDTFKTGFKIISLRYFNPIGAHPSALLGELPIGAPNNLVPYITQAAIGIRPKLTVFGNDYETKDGSCVRDFIHVVDLAKAHLKAMDYLDQVKSGTSYETFNLGTGIGVSVLELIQQFKEVTHVDVPFVIGPRRSGDVEKVYGDPTRANKVLQWKASLSAKDALLHAWEWEKKLKQLS
jgi:UDP-glucose 4-epimerase